MSGLAQAVGQNPRVKKIDVVKKHQTIAKVGLRQKTLS
jgi:hypothetical protein